MFVVKTKISKKNRNIIMGLSVKSTLKTSRFALLAGLWPAFRESDRYKELQKNHLVRSNYTKNEKEKTTLKNDRNIYSVLL